MSSTLIRPFLRSDREQVTNLVNAHIGAVLPGVSASVNAVMSQLEREPGEAIVDPWVSERATLVAIGRERVVAAAHLLRYAAEERVSEFHRNLGEIRWLVCVPQNDSAGDALVAACIQQLTAWQVTRQAADVSLPCPCCYGVPDCWPHLRGEVDSLYVDEAYRCRGLATWLVGHAAEWLRLGHADRLIAYCWPEQNDVLAFARSAGWRELARTERGWVRPTA